MDNKNRRASSKLIIVLDCIHFDPNIANLNNIFGNTTTLRIYSKFVVKWTKDCAEIC